jgi:dTDP-4-dehydrorhamnose 3,5-epimerase
MLTKTYIEGLLAVTPKIFHDERGLFSVVTDEELMKLRPWIQTNSASNRLRGTLRGLHFQTPPFEQTKLVRCVRGAIQDIAVDFRPKSPTYKQWYAAFLTEANHESLLIPPGFLHGYITLEDDTEVEYMVDAPYDAGSCGGFRWNDPAFCIKWMVEPVVMSEADKNYPDF